MQPYLHIFSHFDVPGPLYARKSLQARGLWSLDCEGAGALIPATTCAATRDENLLATRRAGAGIRRRRYHRLRRLSVARKQPVPSTKAPPPARRRRRARAPLACALLALLGGALTGCGSSGTTGTTADPATAVPASAVLYAGATVRPTGTLETNALAAGKALSRQADPYLRLLGTLQTPGSAPLNFQRDLAPWLGPHAGVFLSSLSSASALPAQLGQGLLGGSSSGSFAFGTGRAQGAIVLDTSDAAKASSFLSTQAAKAGAHTTSYRGVRYEVNSEGVAFGLVDRFAVIGSEAGLHSVIETTHGAGALAATSAYTRLLAAAPSDALAHVYSNPTTGAGDGSAGQEGASGLLRLLAGTRPANISLVPSPSSLTLDADTLAPSGSAGGAGGLLAVDPEAAQALAELPGDSWLAIGLGHVGATLGEDAQGLETLSSLPSTLSGGPPEGTAGLTISGLLQGLVTPLRELGAPTAQAKRAFASWMGSAGIFASGANLLELKAAVTITSKNAASSRAAVGELGTQLRKGGASVSSVTIQGTEAAIAVRITGLPVVLDVAAARDAAGNAKFVLGVGEASVATALNPPSTMSDSATRSAAAASLGEGIQPSLIVDFPTFLGLLEGVGLIEAPSLSKYVPYLRSLTTLAGGGHQLGGGVQRLRLVLGLVPAGG
jgi:hypothetical protein